MSLEQLLSDRDSEDERDDEIMDLEDRRVCIPSTIFYVYFTLYLVDLPNIYFPKLEHKVFLCKLHIMVRVFTAHIPVSYVYCSFYCMWC